MECDRGQFIEDYALCEDEERAFFEQFATQWTDFFRRGCWLSGCPVEASAHEKAEWMQNFRHEEIKDWNLKM